MKKLLIVFIVLGVLGVMLLGGLAYADIRVRGLAEAEATRRLDDAIVGARDPVVRIESFPFVGRVLWNGAVPRLVVELASLSSQGVDIERVRLEVDDLQLDRDALLDEQKLVVTSIARARLEGRISASAVERFVKVPIEFSDSKVEVEVEGQRFRGSLSVSSHAIVISVDGLPPMIVPLPEQDYLPCEPEVSLEGDRLLVACSVSELPEAVADVLGQGGV